MAKSSNSLHEKCALNRFMCGGRCAERPAASDAALISSGEVILHGMNISPYEQGNRFNTDPLRPKKLLLHKREIRKLIGYTTQKGLTLVPLRMYFNDDGRAKVELAVARGKKE